MKHFFAIFTILLGAASINVLAEEEEVALAFIECVRVGLDGGVPEAHLPDHNPFAWTRNLTYEFDQTGLKGYVKLDDVFIEDIVDVEVRNVKGAYVDDEKTTINYDYELWWERMRLHGNFIADVTIGLIHHNYEGTFNISVNGWDWKGIWNMTTVSPKQLHNFTMTGATDGVDVTVKGLGIIYDPAVSALLSTFIEDTINNQADIIVKRIIPLLQERFNLLWLDDYYAYRIDAILANCQKHKVKIPEVFLKKE